MKTLIIYNLIPDEIAFFIIPDEDMKVEWENYLIQANGRVVNLDKLNDGMLWLESALSKKKEYCSAEVEEQYHCCLYKYKYNLLNDSNNIDPFIQGPFSKVYVSGYVL